MSIENVQYPPLEERPVKNTICLFDVDGTLTPARRVSSFLVLRIRHDDTGEFGCYTAVDRLH